MCTFLRAAAVLVGLASTFAFVTDGGNPYILAQVGWSDLLLILLIAAVTGLLMSEFLLRMMRPALEGRFFLRYSTMVLAMFLGGVLLGVLLPITGLLSNVPLPWVGLLVNLSEPIVDRAVSALGASLIGAIVGGMLGLLEGLVLAFPLAAIIGRFGDVN